MNFEVTSNVVVDYFGSGMRPSDNEWNCQLWVGLEQIVISLEQSREPFLILESFDANIKISHKTALSSSFAKATDFKLNSKKLLELSYNHLPLILTATTDVKVFLEECLVPKIYGRLRVVQWFCPPLSCRYFCENLWRRRLVDGERSQSHFI